ncbi:MAG: acetylxylan esterase [Acidobacteriaceae bacterium]
MKGLLRIALACAAGAAAAAEAHAQTTMLPSVVETLQKAGPAQPHAVTAFQLEKYLMKRLPALPHPSSAAQWTSEEATLRHHILNDVAYHGWPRQWIDAAPQFEQVGVINTTHGYKILKLRYQIVPGFYSTALLYEPDTISGRVPAILNLLGHEPESIAVGYEQKRCINFAKRGIIALDLGWMGFGELSQPDNDHDFAADLDLAGSNALGLFYLSMKRGLDYLASLPQVDPARIGATGLSGGGWQTTLIGALDPRIAVSVEVAGLGSRESNLTNPRDTYEIEEDAPDLMRGFDYPGFVAMRSPRPTMLIHNAVDSCCFRAPLVEPYLYTNVKTFFQLYDAADSLAWHENFVPGVHNYQLDNRVHAYQFFTEHFHLPVADTEIFSDSEIHTPQQLAIGVPPNNLTILGLARQFASAIHHQPIPSASSAEYATWARSTRERLNSVIRYDPVVVSQALRMANSKGMGFQTLSYRFGFSNELSASGVWFKQDHSPASEPVTLVLNDNGYKAAGQEVFQNLTSGHDVLALDLLFNGASKPEVPDSSDWVLLVDSSGDRSLGLQAAQLVAIARWLRTARGTTQIQLETSGIRNQVIALLAAALDPKAFSSLTIHHGMKSLKYLLDKPVPLRAAPELFCLDLYKYFDIDSITALALPVAVTYSSEPAHPAPAR